MQYVSRRDFIFVKWCGVLVNDCVVECVIDCDVCNLGGTRLWKWVSYWVLCVCLSMCPYMSWAQTYTALAVAGVVEFYENSNSDNC
jgi:hypothetical protein